MDVVDVLAPYLPVVHLCASVDCAVHTQCLSTLCSTHTHHEKICCHNTDYVHINGHDRTINVILAKRCIKLPHDESLVIRKMLKQFEIFLNIL